MSKRSGSAPASSGQNPKPSTPQNVAPGADPEQFGKLPDDFVPSFFAYGLRPTPKGYEVVKVHVCDRDVVEVCHQPEPQRAVAYSYLEGAIMDSFLADRG